MHTLVIRVNCKPQSFGTRYEATIFIFKSVNYARIIHDAHRSTPQFVMENIIDK